MPRNTSQAVAQLPENEQELFKQAQKKYLSDGKGHLSVRKCIMLGVYSIIGLDLKTET